MTKPIPESARDASSQQLPSAVQKEEPSSTILSLLAELELSLKSSQQALLAGNLAGIERHTQEQDHLSRALGSLLSTTGQSFAHEDAHLALLDGAPDLAEEVRAAAQRVLELTRIQAALLDRARHFLMVLSNLLAEPGTNYAPVILRRVAMPPAFETR